MGVVYQTAKKDLNLGDGYSYTVITDQQKSLKNAIDENLPEAEHRCCARHIYANWKKNHPGNALNNAFWRAAKASTVPEQFVHDYFKKTTNLKAYSNLMSPMKGSKEWPIATQINLSPPKARRMLGRPKNIEGGKLMRHNKATCKTDEAEVQENHMKVVEARKAQSEAAKAHSLRNKQNCVNCSFVHLFVDYNNTFIRASTTKKGRPVHTKADDQTLSNEQPPIETTQKKRRGRPPKASTTQIQTERRPYGIGGLN
ncbi:hypothetical protein AgCh_009644 [Apium graveolens]